MSDYRDKHKDAYREEAYELLADLEEALLELEENPQDDDQVGRAFRALHTIKGSGAMFGFDDIAAFAHDIENVFDLVRNHRLAPSVEIINYSLKACDQIKDMLDASTTGEVVPEGQRVEILAYMRQFLVQEKKDVPEAKGAAAPRDPVMAQAAAPVDEGEEGFLKEMSTYRIRFKPGADLFRMGVRPLFMMEDLREIGICYAFAHTEGLPMLSDMDAESCYIWWDIILTTDRGVDAIKDVFVFVEDQASVSIETVDEGGLISDESDYKKLGEILVERGDTTLEDIQGILQNRTLLGEALVGSGLVGNRSVESALAEQQQVKAARRARRSRDLANTVRVPSERLDKLVDLVGELVTVQARLSQLSSHGASAELLGISEEVERLTSELQDNTLSIRMLPIGSTFSRFRRLVRDLSSDLGRDVALETFGADTELDKTVIERLGDPMVHLIRNCIDHGIEPPDAREEVGKDRQGKIVLGARHAGAEVVITISDDGAGIDAEAIYEKAVSRGLVPQGAEMTEAEKLALIFLPGFSTAKKVTDVSGRGVGMDVVKKSIESLRGIVDVQSTKGSSTTIEMRIPLTLAIIEGLLIKIGDGKYIIPLGSVEECVELTSAQVNDAHGRHLVNVRGEMVPYIRLAEHFRFKYKRPETEQVVIVRGEGLRFGFAVDNVIGEHQTVIKSLSKVYRRVQGVSGATILGDGAVALILDVARIYEGAELKERSLVD